MLEPSLNPNCEATDQCVRDHHLESRLRSIRWYTLAKIEHRAMPRYESAELGSPLPLYNTKISEILNAIGTYPATKQ